MVRGAERREPPDRLHFQRIPFDPQGTLLRLISGRFDRTWPDVKTPPAVFPRFSGLTKRHARPYEKIWHARQIQRLLRFPVE